MCLDTAKSQLANSKICIQRRDLNTIDQNFLTSLKNKQKSAYNTTGFAKFQRLRILHNLLLALFESRDKVDNEPWR